MQAVWSRSTYLSCLQHSGLASELIVTAIRNGMQSDLTPQNLKSILDRQRAVVSSANPGYQSLVRRYGADELSDEPSNSPEGLS